MRELSIFTGQPLGPNPPAGSIERSLEDLSLYGFTVLPPENGFNIVEVRREIDSAYLDEVSAFGQSNLAEINDLGVVRNPFLKSNLCRRIAFSAENMRLCQQIFGDQYILHVNRYVISDPEFVHPATQWHREPPYNNLIANKPIALTYIHLPDGSSSINSGLTLLPGSHKWSDFPSDDFVNKNAIVPTIEPGATLVIDSNLFHRGGLKGNQRRRSIVTIFTTPVIKQQTNIAMTVLKKYPHLADEITRGRFILGLQTEPKETDLAYREAKLLK